MAATMDGAVRYDRPVDLSLKNNTHTELVLLTGQGKTVLEVGSATGYITEELLAEAPAAGDAS